MAEEETLASVETERRSGRAISEEREGTGTRAHPLREREREREGGGREGDGARCWKEVPEMLPPSWELRLGTSIIPPESEDSVGDQSESSHEEEMIQNEPSCRT
ncbi:hypothetical protein chiPu_0024152 [Chiloscyllium punctatum]|uniref:Uncharacterized protein n=1 Tax=Chiloscyllium punctatum TaxID=137246 RepID=A0A401TBQ5_CHIPU|nr:hypothetical protein [Chiloscyllium punctatum]